MPVARHLSACARIGTRIVLALSAATLSLGAQTPQATPAIARLVAEPARITMKAGLGSSRTRTCCPTRGRSCVRTARASSSAATAT